MTILIGQLLVQSIAFSPKPFCTRASTPEMAVFFTYQLIPMWIHWSIVGSYLHFCGRVCSTTNFALSNALLLCLAHCTFALVEFNVCLIVCCGNYWLAKTKFWCRMPRVANYKFGSRLASVLSRGDPFGPPACMLHSIHASVVSTVMLSNHLSCSCQVCAKLFCPLTATIVITDSAMLLRDATSPRPLCVCFSFARCLPQFSLKDANLKICFCG